MKVLFSTVTYSDINEKKGQAFKNSMPTFKSSVEKAVHIFIKRFPFLIIFLAYAGFIINECFISTYMVVHELFTHISVIKTDTNASKAIIMCGGVTCIILGITLVFGYKALFFMVRKLLPRKTPLTDREYQYDCFWNETQQIENVLEVMDSITRLSTEDIAYSEMIVEKGSNTITLLLKDSRLGIIKKDTCCISNEDMMKKIEETGELDFTFMDKEWNELLVKYQIQ